MKTTIYSVLFRIRGFAVIFQAEKVHNIVKKVEKHWFKVISIETFFLSFSDYIESDSCIEKIVL